MRRVRVSGRARRDIQTALRRSEEEFGKRARTRYRRLLDQALRDLGEDPARAGVRAIDEVRPGYFTFHLKSSARRAAKPTVQRPRHLIAFYIDESGEVFVARVFHERQMISEGLPEAGC